MARIKYSEAQKEALVGINQMIDDIRLIDKIFQLENTEEAKILIDYQEEAEKKKIQSLALSESEVKRILPILKVRKDKFCKMVLKDCERYNIQLSEEEEQIIRGIDKNTGHA